jgi:hypothetical protein
MNRSSLPVVVIAIAALFCSPGSRGEGESGSPTPKEHKYTADVNKLAEAPPPAPGGVLMVGSSIFRKWTNCVQDLAPLPVTNRAFGGSHTGDQLYFFDKIVPSSKASLVVWYCGSNDVKSKDAPDQILQRTLEWVGMTRKALPDAHILLVSVIRSPEKRTDGLLENVDEVNKGLVQLAQNEKGVSYVDVNPSLEDSSGEPIPECYVADHLHLTPEGYRRMTEVLKPAMQKGMQP